MLTAARSALTTRNTKAYFRPAARVRVLLKSSRAKDLGRNKREYGSPGSGKPTKQQKRAAIGACANIGRGGCIRARTPKHQLPDVAEGDAAQDASEPEEETQNPELAIEIATGRRYALIAKNLDAVTASQRRAYSHGHPQDGLRALWVPLSPCWTTSAMDMQ